MNRKVWLGLVASVAVLVVLAGSVAAQSSLPPTTTVAAAKPADKLSFRLAALARSEALRAASAEDQARALSLPAQGAGSLLRNDQGQLLVYVRMADLSGASLQALRDAGAQIIHVSDRYQVVTAFVGASSLPSIASQSAVQSVEEGLTPMMGGDMPTPPQTNARVPTTVSCPQGAYVSEGDTQLNAALARSTYHVDGAGVTIGILSDSFNKNPAALIHANNDIASGDLPGPGNPCGQLAAVNVISESLTNAGDEGRAMLQIVHDLAPTSTLMFATAWNGLFSFGDNIRSLRAAGADIIADDVFYFDEPFFQEGPINVAISDVVHSGALYFALAGNNNYLLNGQNVGSYEAPYYRPTTCPPSLGLSGDCHNFEPIAGVNAAAGITLTAGGELAVDFQWAEPWYGVTDDLDIYLLDDGNNPVAWSNDNNLITQTPFEYFDYINTTGRTQRFQLMINRAAGTGTPRLKYMFLQYTAGVLGAQYNTSKGGDIVGPTLYGHSSNRDGFSVAAVPYNNSNAPEYYTSRGPATYYFGPVVSANPAPAISPDVIQQPDFAATDGGCTTFFGSFSNGCYRFFGTSAATPHAAAVAALLKQPANQLGVTLTPALLKSVLQSTAQPVSGGDVNSVGAGLIDADAALGGITPAAPQVTSALTAAGTLGLPFSYTFTASGTLPITLTVTGLPAWARFTSPVISGTPTLTGTFPVTLTATNSAGSDNKTLDITISAGFKVYLPLVIR